MSKEEAIALIDAHKNQLTNPMEMLHWTWLRVILLYLDDTAWANALTAAMSGPLSR